SNHIYVSDIGEYLNIKNSNSVQMLSPSACYNRNGTNKIEIENDEEI
ncbi:unnamed protein product, partial [Rotaria magnacalcarata]